MTSLYLVCRGSNPLFGSNYESKKLLSLIGIAPFAAKFGPLVAKLVPAPKVYQTYICGSEAMIGGYNEYVNFSSFAIAQSIDECVQRSAEELGHQVGKTVSSMVDMV